MPDYTPPVDDILYLLRRVIDVEGLLRLPAFAHVDTDTVEDVVRAAGALTAEVIGPINEACDREGARYANGRVTLPPGFVDAYHTFRDQGWPSLVLPEAYGGQALPEVVQGALSEMLNGASIAFTMLPTPVRAAARVLEAHATDALRAAYLPRLVSGEWAATISMTEPHAGSDIGLARTKAVPRGDGSYAVSGTKIFISFADHDAAEQIVHIVLARTEGAPAGVRGLSLFLVPKFLPNPDGSLGTRNGVRVQRIEEKMGIHGSPTCEVLFEEATGWLLGEELRGIQNMFTMINTMRTEVAFEGVGVAGAATANALRYAAERPQGVNGKGDGGPVPIIEHPDVRRMLLTMKALTGGARALAYETARQLDLSRAAETEEERALAGDVVSFLLPICKACFTDIGCEVASIGIQVFGGHGYCHENGAEQYLRDARITPIFEGTNGIQAIDLLTRKLPRHDGAAFRALTERIEADLGRFDGDARVLAIHQAVETGLALLHDASNQLMATLAETPRAALAGATPYLQLAGRTYIGWMWLRAAGDAGDDPIGEEYRVLARFYAEQIMADSHALLARALAGAEAIDALSAEQIARV